MSPIPHSYPRTQKPNTSVRLSVPNDHDFDGGPIAQTEPQLFLSFGNHLGSTSAVIDYKDGALVEWRTHYAYGADETHWKNLTPDPDNPDEQKYGNAEEPYGFTGKEEDVEVGLHYFGARYYSSYLGRWLSPDAPVVHGGGIANYYNYGANSPYIYIDPDGNNPAVAIAIALTCHQYQPSRPTGDQVPLLQDPPRPPQQLLLFSVSTFLKRNLYDVPVGARSV